MPAHDMTISPMITCAGCKQSYADTALFCPNCGTAKPREAVATDPLVGKILGERFQVQEFIGQGASGTIYRAEHVTLRRRVAIKVLHNELSRDDLAVERFRREATTVAEIDNEHIVEIHDFGRTQDGRLYLAMELLEGETLDHVLAREKTLSVERTADILIQVGEALMEAHAIGYVHRDLRPRNVYLAVRRGKANFVKLLDFGLAKLVETDAQAASTSLGMTFGDPRYMSPEQARGDRIDRRADIYQLGCVVYEMLTGEPPFTGNRVFDILSKQVTEIPAPLPTRRPGVPLWMEAAVAKMLAKDPENRFATTTRMVEALRLGLETGQIMEDEIARRRESIPPPSVSRVMQKMGLPGPVDPPAAPVVGKETLKGHLEGPGASPVTTPAPVAPSRPVSAPMPAAPAAAVAPPVNVSGPPAMPPPLVIEAPPRRRTGTPDVGVPAISGQIEAAGRRKRSSTGGGALSTESSVWFEDGERASEEADNIRRRKAPILTPSSTDLSLYDEPIQRRRWPIIVAGLGVVGVVAAALAFGMKSDKPSTKPAAAEPVATTPAITPVPDVPPSQVIEQGSAAVAQKQPAVATKPVTKETKSKSSSSTGFGTPPPKVKTTTTTNDDAASRRPTGGGWFDSQNPTTTDTTPAATNNTPTTTIITPPTTNTPSGVSGSEGPLDPYGGGGTDSSTTPPTDSASPDKKAEFFAQVGQQQLVSGDTTGAAASFKKALELDPKNIVSVIGMGDIALRQGLFGDAISHLKKAAKLAPKSSRVFTLLGEAYLNSGNNAVAADNFKKALQLDPENTRARDGYNEASSKVPPPEDE